MKNRRFSVGRVLHGGSLILLLSVLSVSCASLSRYQGIGRIRKYVVEDERLPEAFNGFTIAFVSDTHFPSKLTSRRLGSVVRAINDLSPDLLLLGGDYVSSPLYMDELFTAFAQCETSYGKYAVLGNHDTGICDELCDVMRNNGIVPLLDVADTITVDSSDIYLCGVKNYKSFSLPEYITAHSASGFTIVLVHTPDYAQNTAMKNVSLVLAGHTHGGQVTLFGLYAPVTNSRYGKRFLSGLNLTDSSVPVITSNGLGTSRKKIRFCAPSDIVCITLKCKIKTE